MNVGGGQEKWRLSTKILKVCWGGGGLGRLKDSDQEPALVAGAWVRHCAARSAPLPGIGPGHHGRNHRDRRRSPAPIPIKNVHTSTDSLCTCCIACLVFAKGSIADDADTKYGLPCTPQTVMGAKNTHAKKYIDITAFVHSLGRLFI